MPQIIEITCPTCGYQWQVDLDKEQKARVIFRRAKPIDNTERYRFRCPKEGTWTVVSIERKERDDA